MNIFRASKEGQAFYAELCDTVVRRIDGLPFDAITYTGEEYNLCDVEIMVPCQPSKIVAVGLNYAKHAGEMKEKLIGNPILFMKPATSIVAHGQDIEYPSISSRVDYEAELGVVIKKTCKKVSVQDAMEYVFGYTALNDVTARDLQKSDGQWTRAKSFDTFCPFGPYINTAYDPKNKRVTSVLNGQIRQDGNTDEMLFGVAELISYISECMTLLPGDVIATGTPEGIGPMQKADIIEIKIEGLTTLENKVK